MTSDEIKTSIYASLSASGLPVTAWKPGAVVRTLIAAIAVAISTLYQVIYLLRDASLLSTATGSWLELSAKDYTNTDRPVATIATCTCEVFTNGTGGDFDPGDLVVSNPVTGYTYTNTTTLSVEPPYYVGTATFAATGSGSAYSTSAGTITAFGPGGWQPLAGATVINTTAAVGTDMATDDELRALAMTALDVLSPAGPRDAARHVAMSAGLGVTRVTATPSSSIGQVDVYLASASGAVGSDVLTAVDDLIQAQVCPTGQTYYVHSASNKTVTVIANLKVYASIGAGLETLTTRIATALAALMSQQPIGGHGGWLYIDTIEAAIRAVDSHIFSATVLPMDIVGTHPDNAFVAMTATQVPVLGTDSVTTVEVYT